MRSRTWIWVAVALAVAGTAVLVRARWPRWRYGRLRADPQTYEALVTATAQRHGIPPTLVLAVIWKESRFRADAVGKAGEVGLMQITEGAVIDWKEYHARRIPPRHLWFSPELNIEIGTWYLARAMRTWRNHRSADILALAEYNAGPSRARRWAPEDPQRELTLDNVSLLSTREYIRQVKQKWSEFEKRNQPRE